MPRSVVFFALGLVFGTVCAVTYHFAEEQYAQMEYKAQIDETCFRYGKFECCYNEKVPKNATDNDTNASDEFGAEW